MKRKNERRAVSGPIGAPNAGDVSTAKPSRRGFIKGAGAVAGLVLATSIKPSNGALDVGATDAIAAPKSTSNGNSAGPTRRSAAYKIRVGAAQSEMQVPIPAHPNNGDEALYSNRIGNFSKGLPHDSFGEVNANAYNALLKAVNSGNPADFDAIPLGGTVKLVDPQAGLAFDLEGTDSHQLAIPPSPALASAQRAGEMVEDYWMALLRDVPFIDYGSDAGIAAAIADINNLSDFRGPRDSGTGLVTPATVFRGFTDGDLIGPYVSQFFYPTIQYGVARISQQYQTDLSIPLGGQDFMITFPNWLKVRNGTPPFETATPDPTLRYIRSGRDLAAYVHVDVLFEAYFNACIWLVDQGAPFNVGNPYKNSHNQQGFGTFGAPHIKALVAEVATRALKAVWFQKWFVHRALRPEEMGGLVHLTATGAKSYPLHSDVLNSTALPELFTRNGTYLLPMAFVEGCPQHPSYGEGHGTVAGACATIVKAYFDESYVIPNPVVASADGLSLVPYGGADAGQITLGGEMNKIAANVALGRDHAGVHWRSDYQEAVLLGEQIAISILADQRATYNENFQGFTFTKFDGTTITV